MSSTRTPGIRIDNRTNCLIIDKEHRGIPIYVRLGVTDQDSAERRLSEEVRCVNEMLALRSSRRATFADCAGRYLSAFKGKHAAEVTAWHIRLLLPYIGRLDVHSVHDATLQSFIADRVASGVCATTINRTLEVVRSILVRAARSYRHQDGTPWLRTMPPLITMLEETPRLPCPITWNEQDQLFSRLPARLARMVLFAVNTGLRESNVCKLQWEWEVAVPEVGRSVFVVPPEAYKTRRAHVVILNDVAWSVIQGQRGQDAVWVFPYRGKPVGTMNNTAWQRARKEVGLPRVRIHDLRHIFACRLRAVGVSMEDRQVLLGHASRSMAGHYASADVGRLLGQANLVLKREETRTVLRVANAGSLWIKGPAEVRQAHKRAHLTLVSP